MVRCKCLSLRKIQSDLLSVRHATLVGEEVFEFESLNQWGGPGKRSVARLLRQMKESAVGGYLAINKDGGCMDEKGGDKEIWAAATNNGQHNNKVCLQVVGSHVNNVTACVWKQPWGPGRGGASVPKEE
jgi:hypothetical protein